MAYALLALDGMAPGDRPHRTIVLMGAPRR